MRKVKAVLAGLLCLVAAGGGALFGCSGGDYKTAELKYYSYGESKLKDDYNTNLFYRNEYTVALGDPTTIYVTEGEDKGWFYSTGTSLNTGFAMYRSKDFVNWELVPGGGFLKDSEHFGETHFWAPQLIYDKDAEWSHYNMGEEGKGLYFLFYCARVPENSTKLWGGVQYWAVAVSTTPGGPYIEYEGVNGHGQKMNASTPVMNLDYINPDSDKFILPSKDHPVTKLYKERRSFIDACPYIDPVTGKKYLYGVRSRANDVSNDIWGMEMIDWVTPDYTTLTELTVQGYTRPDKKERYNWTKNTGKIDEGPFVYYHDGKYYMTFSLGDTNDKYYPVAQAIGDSPLGPFEKVQPEDGGVFCSPEIDWDVHSAGHHSFFEAGDELFIVYHSYETLLDREFASRYQGFDRVSFVKNDKGQTILHTNGPTKSIQPLPEVVSGYKNVAPLAKVKATGGVKGSSPELLNNGMFLTHTEEGLNDFVKEFEVKGDSTEITLTFDDYVTARAIMVYNAHDYNKIFDEVERIEFSYRDEDGKTGIYYINNLKYSRDANLVPMDYLFDQDTIANDVTEADSVVRPGGAAVAEFNEMSVKQIKIKIKKGKDKEGLNIADIVVLGKTA